jgi:hypothetical protein
MRFAGGVTLLAVGLMLVVVGAVLVVVTVMSMGGDEFFVPALLICLLLWITATFVSWRGIRLLRHRA